MRPTAVVLACLAACGRIAFDPVSRSEDAGHVDAGPTIPSGAKIWLRMETAPTTGIVDSAGNHAVACAGTCPQPVAGKHGEGYQFAMEEVDVANAPDLDSSAGFTGAIWIELLEIPASLACVWTKPFDNNKGYDTFTICIDPSGDVVFDSETPGGVADSQTTMAISVGAWHHLAFSWDAQSQTKAGYIDGAVAVTSTVMLGAGSEPVALGAARGSFFTPAIVDDALYYTRALSAAEIASLAAP